MSWRQLVSFALLGLAVLGSAMAVVHAEFESRRLFVELEELRKQRDRLDREWRNLRLEQSTWAVHGLIERHARERLDMHAPSAAEIVVIDPR